MHIIGVALLMIVREGYGLQCYNEPLHNGTQDVQVSIETCTDNQNQCATIFLISNGSSSVGRKCTSGYFISCSIQCAIFYTSYSPCQITCCDKDLCNSDASELLTQTTTSIPKMQTTRPYTTPYKPTPMPIMSKILQFLSKLFSKIANLFFKH
ncbi:uncharacterized protein LOC124815292 [Hydra vulgaris]|uniref:uncharacterized protein LOC124815292 n=1 Tax=Hydra vulgaris TaxID=6087 RepID=UPI001F5F59C7|nr:uncharacterized protein LOC124815292 [Hydra vulgaris]